MGSLPSQVRNCRTRELAETPGRESSRGFSISYGRTDHRGVSLTGTAGDRSWGAEVDQSGEHLIRPRSQLVGPIRAELLPDPNIPSRQPGAAPQVVSVG